MFTRTVRPAVALARAAQQQQQQQGMATLRELEQR
jgi:hypothetical protein